MEAQLVRDYTGGGCVDFECNNKSFPFSINKTNFSETRCNNIIYLTRTVKNKTILKPYQHGITYYFSNHNNLIG